MLNFNFSEKGLELVSPPHFVYDFQEKCFSCYVLLTDQISLSDCLYFLRYWAICVFNCLLTRLWHNKFWNWADLSNPAAFLDDQKVNTKISISWERHFSSFLKGFQLPQIVSDSKVRLLSSIKEINRFINKEMPQFTLKLLLG